MLKMLLHSKANSLFVCQCWKKIRFYVFPLRAFFCFERSAAAAANAKRSITKIKEGGGLETEKNPKKKTKESFEAEIRKINLKKAFAKKK